MSPEPAPRRPTPRLIAAVFAVFFGVLALGYVVFLRPDYVPVFSQVRPAEAAAIVAQLEAKKIGYRLADGGATVLVPGDQADMARLAIAGSDVALKGGVGFELFNKSDMGLTDFAQRINYQRALQGELERSIMMIEEIETARVHLAMPERTIFRSERSNAKAAVELVLKPGKPFDEPRVVGVQRLVAFAVPDLVASDVVILDGDGRVLSQSGGDDTFLSPDAEEQRSMQGYYRGRARAALRQALPGVQADVRVVAIGGDATAATAPAPTDAADKPVRNFRLRVTVSTAAAINEEETMLARNAVAAAVALDEAAGDELVFQLGLPAVAPPPPMTPAYPAVSAAARTVVPATAMPWLYWIVGAIMLLIAGGLILPRVRARARLSATERDAMVARVRAALHPTEAGHV